MTVIFASYDGDSPQAPRPTLASPYAWSCCECSAYGQGTNSDAALLHAYRHGRDKLHRVRVMAHGCAAVHLGAEECKAHAG